MGQSLLIRDAEMVFDGKVTLGDLRSTAGVIEAIAPGGGLTPREGEVVIDGEGLHLLPGAIDPQVHFREPGQPEKEDMAAAAWPLRLVASQPSSTCPTTSPLLPAWRQCKPS